MENGHQEISRCHDVNSSIVCPFYAVGLFLYPRKHQKTKYVLMFSVGIKRDQWHKMGYVFIISVAYKSLKFTQAHDKPCFYCINLRLG